MLQWVAGFGLAMLLVLVGCGDSPTTTSAPTPPPPTPPPVAPSPPVTPANLVLSGSYECTNRFCDSATYSIELTNTGGETANVNYIRGENRNDQPIWEFGANTFIEMFGTNRLQPGQTFAGQFVRQLGFYIVVGYGDARGQNWFVKERLNPPR